MYIMCLCPTYQAIVLVVRSKPSAMPCHAKREGSWRRDTIVFATYLPHSLVRFAATLKSNHSYNLPIMSDRFNVRSPVTSPEIRLDMKARSFWSRGVTELFDIRVRHVKY